MSSEKIGASAQLVYDAVITVQAVLRGKGQQSAGTSLSSAHLEEGQRGLNDVVAAAIQAQI